MNPSKKKGLEEEEEEEEEREEEEEEEGCSILWRWRQRRREADERASGRRKKGNFPFRSSLRSNKMKGRWQRT